MFWESIQSSRLWGAWCWHWGRAQFCSAGHSEEGWPQDSSHSTTWQAFGVICCGDWASHSETVRQVSENCILGFSRQNKKLFNDKLGKPPVLLLWLIYITYQYYVLNCQLVTSGKWYNPLSYLERKMCGVFLMNFICYGTFPTDVPNQFHPYLEGPLWFTIQHLLLWFHPDSVSSPSLNTRH